MWVCGKWQQKRAATLLVFQSFAFRRYLCQKWMKLFKIEYSWRTWISCWSCETGRYIGYDPMNFYGRFFWCRHMRLMNKKRSEVFNIYGIYQFGAQNKTALWYEPMYVLNSKLFQSVYDKVHIIVLWVWIHKVKMDYQHVILL